MRTHTCGLPCSLSMLDSAPREKRYTHPPERQRKSRGLKGRERKKERKKKNFWGVNGLVSDL